MGIVRVTRSDESLKSLLGVSLILSLLMWKAQSQSNNSSSSSDGEDLPAYFIPSDNILMNCGASGEGSDGEGRTWIGDGNSRYAPRTSSKVLSLKAANQAPEIPSEVPYMTARIFTESATYSFVASPGRHWLRLHFYPCDYGSYKESDALFTVVANEFVLLQNFSSGQTANALNQAYLVREYSINVTGSHLNVTFSPESVKGAYAFVNGIEVVSMPGGLFQTATLVGTSGSITIGPSWTMLTVYRMNVGGSSISAARDSNLSRTWYDDSPYIYGAGFGTTSDNSSSGAQAGPVQYTSSVPAYFAPQDVYATFRQMLPDGELNENTNLSWVVPIDSNFTYYVRMHFCEWIYTKTNQRVFNIYLNNQSAFTGMDVIAVTGSTGIPTYMDFAIYVSPQTNDTDMWVELQPDVSSEPQYYQALLNGLEIFKINDSSGSLAGPNPVPAPSVDYTGPDTTSESPTSSKKSKAPIIGGIIGGGVALVLLLGGLCLCFIHCRSGKSGGDRQSAWFIPLYGNSQTIASKVSTTSGTGSYVSSVPSSFCRHFSFAEIQEATSDFDESRLLGVGGFGKVYQGEIDGGIKVAVKRGNPLAEQGVHEFQTEIEMLSKLRHRHLVSLIGYCEENCEMILVYDYMAKGPLRGHLYGNANLTPLTWKQRLEICIGAARGLHYLHTGAAHTIIHRDVKTTNILLDENLVAKVSDFGLSKTGPTLDRTHVSTVVKGSFGYLDPEYYRRQQLTEKSDVYSFGVVLFEVLCARPAINPSLPREQVSIAEWALSHQRRGLLEQIIDPYLKGKINPESLKKYAEAAEKCLAEQGIDRPSMGDVLWNLEFALQLQENAIENKLVDDSTNVFLEVAPEDSQSATFPVNTQTTITTTSTGTQSLASDDLDDVTPSAVFSQLVNPQGR
eukprot:TRINITY_DN24939_c0_g1_i1.p1 TRINITY_DN24939_c0_g1~~TRINITY_DN24939_c0_g1_i1.p1  ORF type:complete len:902 (+),score=104.80 TRINITY_DN24939_c0_g1_i1:467-3172(+)